jgi:hypothetical protein
VTQRKISGNTSPAPEHPKLANWTDDALPLPDRIELLRQELARVQEARQRAQAQRAERPG